MRLTSSDAVCYMYQSSIIVTKQEICELSEQDKLRNAVQFFEESLLRTILHAWRNVSRAGKQAKHGMDNGMMMPATKKVNPQH